MGTQIVQYKKYIAGWQDSTVHDFLLGFPNAFPSMQFALITCLDSNRDLAVAIESSDELAGLRSEIERVGNGLLLPTSVLMNYEATNRILFGFDEIWFFPQEKIQPKPAGSGLVGPNRISQERIDSLGDWMERNACTIGVGDGEGLNLVLKVQGLMRYVLGNSIQQPAVSQVAG